MHYSVCRNILDGGVIYSPENTSNHSAIFKKLEISGLDLEIEKYLPPSRSSWKKASEGQMKKYGDTHRSKLSQSPIPKALHEYDNVHCNVHEQDLDVYALNLL